MTYILADPGLIFYIFVWERKVTCVLLTNLCALPLSFPLPLALVHRSLSLSLSLTLSVCTFYLTLSLALTLFVNINKFPLSSISHLETTNIASIRLLGPNLIHSLKALSTQNGVNLTHGFPGIFFFLCYGQNQSKQKILQFIVT